MSQIFKQRYRRKEDASDYFAGVHSYGVLKGVRCRIRVDGKVGKKRVEYSHRETFGKGGVDELGWPK